MTGRDERTVVRYAAAPARGSTATGTALLVAAMPVLAAIEASGAGSGEVPAALMSAYERSVRHIARPLAEAAVLIVHATAAAAKRRPSDDPRIARIGAAMATDPGDLRDLAPLYDVCVACGLTAPGQRRAPAAPVYLVRAAPSEGQAITDRATAWSPLAVGFAGALMITVVVGGALWAAAGSARSSAERSVATVLAGDAP